MKIKFERGDIYIGNQKKTLGAVEIALDDRNEVRLIQGEMYKKAKHLSRNEKNEIIAALEREIVSLETVNVPQVYRDMLTELKGI